MGEKVFYIAREIVKSYEERLHISKHYGFA